MRFPAATLVACLVPALALSACGSKEKKVDAAAYTCKQFDNSLKTKNDNSAGNFINQLVKQANLEHSGKTARSEVTVGIYFTCRNKPGSTKPAHGAVRVAQRIEAGKFHLPGSGKKKSK